MKLTDLYAEYFANLISGGGLINRDKISLLGIRPLFDRYLTNQYITKAWMMLSVPVHFDKNLTQLIRTEMHDIHPSVTTIIHLYNSPVNVKVFSDSFKRHMRASADQFYKYREIFDSLSDIDKETGLEERGADGGKFRINIETLNSIRDAYDSYMYVHRTVAGGKTFSNTYYFIQASCKSKDDMNKYSKDLERMLQGLGIVIRRVKGNVGQYLDNFCPAAYTQEKPGKFRTMLMSQENVASFMPTVTKGLVGKEGVMVGVDWDTKLPFRLDLTSAGAAQVILIEGKSGCGKTMLSFAMTVSLISFGVHCSVTDIKGGEWSKLKQYVDTLEIDMSGDSARFVNLMRLDDLNCTVKNSVEAYDRAIMNTVGFFEVCTNLQQNEGNVSDLRSILNQAVEKVYNTAGIVKTNPKTFTRTRNFQYSDVLEVLSTLEYSKTYTEQQRKICRLIKVRSSTFVMGEGRYSAAFKNELTVADVLNTPLIIYNFNKNVGESLDMIDNIRVYMSRCLDSRKHFMRKQQGLHQAAFYEELQRCGSMDVFVRNISADVTGSRSNNLTVFLLMNAISTLDEKAFAAIKSNITTKIIGLSNTHDIKKLVSDYDCGDIEGYMHKIHDNKNGAYNNCFAVSYDVGNDKDSLILKSVLPKDMLKAFATRDKYVIG